MVNRLLWSRVKSFRIYVAHWGYKFQVWSDLTFTFVLPPGHIIMQQSCWQLALSSGSGLPYPRCWKTPGTVVSAEVPQYPDLKMATSSCGWMTTVWRARLQSYHHNVSHRISCRALPNTATSWGRNWLFCGGGWCRPRRRQIRKGPCFRQLLKRQYANFRPFLGMP